MNYVKAQMSKNMRTNRLINFSHILSNFCKGKIVNTENYTCTCKDCNGTFDIDDTIKTKYGDKICHDCYREHYTICDICGSIIYTSDVSTLQFGTNTLDVCEDCALQLNNIICEKNDNRTLLHHYTNKCDYFIQFEIKVILKTKLNNMDYFDIIHNIDDICSIHNVPLLFIKQSDDTDCLHIITHYLSLDTIHSILSKLITYLTFNNNVSHFESLKVCLECKKESECLCSTQLQDFLMNLFLNIDISFDVTQSSKYLEFSTDIIPEILDKAKLYRVYSQYINKIKN